MASIPIHKKWMADTHSLTRPRSPLLKNLDERILAFGQIPNGTNRNNVQGALNRWIADQTQQGKDWKQSVRNKTGAVTELYRAVNDDARNLSDEEREALRYIARQQSMALFLQFQNKEVQFKSTTLLGLRNRASDNWTRFKTGAGGVKDLGLKVYSGVSSAKALSGIPGQLATLNSGGASAVQAEDVAGMKLKIMELIQTLCHDVDPHHVFNALSLGSPETFVAELAPFLGAISSGGKAVIGWITVVKLAFYDDARIKRATYAIRAGDPMAALAAVSALLDREINSEAAKAGIATAAFAGKMAGAFADGGAITGPVLGAVEKLANIFQIIFEYVRDYREVRAANEMLAVGALNLDLFDVCPVLGCYFLVVQDHSTIINFAVADYGTVNWKFDVEQLVKRIDVVLGKARHYIAVSRFEIPGMQHAKGVQDAAWSHKHGLSKVLGAPGAAADKVTSVPGAVKARIMAQIDQWKGRPEKPPKVDKSRIRGISNCWWR